MLTRNFGGLAMRQGTRPTRLSDSLLADVSTLMLRVGAATTVNLSYNQMTSSDSDKDATSS
jgi:hypothetical protein